jgi:branched-chain amino acid transport system permease protein
MNRAWPAIGGLAFAVLLVVLSRFLSSYYLVLSTRILIFAIFAMSLDLLVGYVGLSSLGHAAFFGFSGYATALLALRVANNMALTIGAAVLATLVMAMGYSALALRAKGVYFLMLTLALSQVLWGIAFEWRTLTHGDDGLPGIPRPVIGGFQMSDSGSFFLFAGGLFIISAAILLLIVHSPFGLTLQGIRESASRMSALGYNVWLHRYLAFLISSVFAATAGSLIAYQNGIVSPTQLQVVTSAEALLMVILGGAGTIVGPFIGSIVIVLLEFLISQHTDRWEMALGIIYIFVVMGAPRGIYPPIRDAVARLVLRERRGSGRTAMDLVEPAPGISLSADS